MINQITARLAMFGYTVTNDDLATLTFLGGKVTAEIFNFCNISVLPVGLQFAAVDMICGEFLQQRLETNPDSLSGINYGESIKAISEGDTSVTYTDGTRGINELIDTLTTDGKTQLLTFRRLKW